MVSPKQIKKRKSNEQFKFEYAKKSKGFLALKNSQNFYSEYRKLKRKNHKAILEELE